MKKNIIVSLQVQGIHRWLECDIPEVLFLRDPHRHIFYITCKKEVNDSNREIEFIMLKNEILSYINETKKIGNIIQFGNMSCEMIAEHLMDQFDLSYCSVLEDNENGAEVYND